MGEDVIYSPQFYVIYLNQTILANLQRRPLKLGRLKALQEYTYGYKKLCSHGNSLFSSPQPVCCHGKKLLSLYSGAQLVELNAVSYNLA